MIDSIPEQAARTSPAQSRRPAGGKAGNLAELQRAGFNVPEFVCSPADLLAAIRTLGFPLAVRSSASVEDGAAASFAGQFKTFLGLNTTREARDAVDQCRQSLHEPSVAAYCRHNGIDPESVVMDVVVQRMIQPDLAGVAFTVNPRTGADEVVIEACAGVADDLLAGKQSPLSPNHPLLRRHAAEIEETARRIHRHFGMPQDIEFAVQNGELFILQSRPVTRIEFSPETGAWTNADFRDGGVSCRVCTPLMWSLYDFVWEETLKGFLKEIRLFRREFQAGRMFHGRPYWNLGAVKDCLALLPGYDERKFNEDLGVVTTPEVEAAKTPVTVPGVLRALPTVLAVGKTWKEQARFDKEFLKSGFEKLIAPYAELPSDREPPLAELISGPYQITESNYFRTIFCASLARMAFKDSFPDVDCNALVAELPRLRHLEPVLALRQMAAEDQTDIQPLLQRFAHHSRRELDISCPRWDEDPEWVRLLLEQAGDPPPAKPRRQFKEVFEETLRQIPWHRRRAFRRKLTRLRHFLWLREEMRDLSSRVYHLIRKQVLDIARRRGLGDDIFFMSFQEIVSDDRSRIEPNRDLYERYRNFNAPNEIGSRFRFSPAPSNGRLQGISASGGVVRGVARIARTIEEAAAIEPGALLVCPFTDPGWTPVLGKVAGVVTENGGQLSHAAVICREYGIPAVLSVPNATGRIRDRSHIIINGDTGEIHFTNPSKSTVAERVKVQSSFENSPKPSQSNSDCPEPVEG